MLSLAADVDTVPAAMQDTRPLTEAGNIDFAGARGCIIAIS
jgi:hypothetical protein